MGFSVSGATVIIILGLLVAFGVAMATVPAGIDQVTSAQSASSDRLLGQQNTDFEIVDAKWDDEPGGLLGFLFPEAEGLVIVNANNTGTTTIEIDDIDVLVDGTYREEVHTAVNGNNETRLWQPNETIEITAPLFEEGADPERVKVIVTHGISESAGVG